MALLHFGSSVKCHRGQSEPFDIGKRRQEVEILRLSLQGNLSPHLFKVCNVSSKAVSV